MTDPTTEKTVVLRGAPWKLLKRLTRHAKDVKAGNAQPLIFEVLIEGAGGGGKSHGDAQILWYLGNRYPGTRWLVIREVRADLATTFQKIWEEDVVPASHPMLARAKPIARASRKSYNFWNGPQLNGAHPTVGASVIELGGMDDVQRHRGTDYDGVVFLELVECRSEPDYTEFLRSLRNWGGWREKIPFQLLISETNPDAPDNWVNLRFGDENMQRLIEDARAKNFPYTIWRLVSQHRDNPKWWQNGDWTPEGRAYIGALDAIPGVRGQRLRWGRWVGAEGMVYEFDRARHIVERPKPRPIMRAFVAAMDWGYTDPCCLLVAGIERDTGHLHIVAEIYRIKKSVDWWADRVIELKGEYQLKALVVDPSRPEVIEKFNRAVCAQPDVPFAIGADNRRASSGDGDMGGIDTVRWYLDGRLVFWSDRMREGPDQELIDTKQPTNTCAEFGSYVYRTAPRSGAEIANRRKELTDDTAPDHGCFVAGTPIATPDGEQAIETLRPGDIVTTPAGPRRVTHACMTQASAEVWTLTTTDGHTITATGDHPIWTPRGFLRLDALRYGDTVATWLPPSASSGADSSGIATRTRRILRSGTTSVATHGATASCGHSGFTKRSTVPTTGRSLAECTFTTSTMTQRTTIRRTSRCSLRKSIEPNTPRRWRPPYAKLRSGTRVRKAGSGIGSTPAIVCSVASTTGCTPANSAGRSITSARSVRDSAETTASQPTAAQLASMTRRAHAPSAASGSTRTATARSGIALSRVAAVRAEPMRRAVYNLTVEGEHVYFAGGVLASNCDALRYLCTYVKNRYGKFVHEATGARHISARDRQVAKDMGFELPPEPEV